MSGLWAVLEMGKPEKNAFTGSLRCLTIATYLLRRDSAGESLCREKLSAFVKMRLFAYEARALGPFVSRRDFVLIQLRDDCAVCTPFLFSSPDDAHVNFRLDESMDMCFLSSRICLVAACTFRTRATACAPLTLSLTKSSIVHAQVTDFQPSDGDS
ncbi:hypothetical protein R3P38DRAFT_3287096 [Favolaschia claudopus]|uniref:Uncharacterized protein n=1 Tax=Favolaschia claudopus TaxID=2862362 RepID=A0AAW0A2D6_9AGAR